MAIRQNWRTYEEISALKRACRSACVKKLGLILPEHEDHLTIDSNVDAVASRRAKIAHNAVCGGVEGEIFDMLSRTAESTPEQFGKAVRGLCRELRIEDEVSMENGRFSVDGAVPFLIRIMRAIAEHKVHAAAQLRLDAEILEVWIRDIEFISQKTKLR